MGLFNNLMSKIFGHATPAAKASGTQTQTAASGAPATGSAPQTQAAGAPAAPPVVDVAAIMDDLAKKNPEKLDWRVDRRLDEACGHGQQPVGAETTRHRAAL